MSASINDKTKVISVFVTSALAGDNTLVAAVTGLKYKVIGFVMGSTAGQNMVFKSATTEISGTFALSANKILSVSPTRGVHWCQTAAGEALVINFSAAVANSSAHVLYEVSAY